MTLPVPYLADVAVVVHRPPPPAEDQPHWIRYATGDPGPVTGLAGWPTVESVPGLVEALEATSPNRVPGWTPSWPTWPRCCPPGSAVRAPC
ncbi:hypothetical protein V2I01_06065 [Micromonospora sp. BRA006-A]|nr:hypothetical protein [Micromonospora sp. BRA006-A]